MQIDINTVAVNEPSKLTFVVPATLPAGDYQLQITTQYSKSATFLKEARSALFEYYLTV